MSEPLNRDMQDYLISGKRLRQDQYSNDGNVKLTSNVTITDDDVFLYNSDVNIVDNIDDVLNIINYHETYIADKYTIKRDYYKGRHHGIINAPEKEMNKPDNRLVFNLPKKLVNTFNGYFAGEPVSIKYQSDTDGSSDNDSLNDKIQSWLSDNDYADVFSEWSKQADIYGRSYLRLYQVNSEIKMTVCSPRDTIIVYDDSVEHKPICAIRYSTSLIEGTLITATQDYQFEQQSDSGGLAFTNLEANKDGEMVIAPKDVHTFPILPVIELEEDDERTGIFDDVISLIDAIDFVQSAKDNDISSFSNEYMVVKGQKLTAEQVRDITDNRLINLYQNSKASFNTNNPIQPSVEFLTPDSNDETQEHFLDRVIDQVYQISQVVNLNDSNFGMSAQSISGVALLQRYQPMQAKARTKALKMDKALRQVFTILFASWNAGAKVSDLTFDHKQSIPHNVLEEAQTVATLNGQVSDVTKLSYLSGIDDPQKEVDRLDKQNKDNEQHAQELAKQYLPDQQNGGVNDDNNQSGAPADQSTNQPGQSDGPAKQ